MKLGDEYKLYGEDDSCIATTQESPHKRLSKQNCDTIFGATDVNELANQNAKKDLFNGGYDGLINAHQQMLIEVSYINGFKKAMELNKDKLFTEDQMWNMFYFGDSLKIKIKSGNIDNKPMGEIFDDYIQSLQQPTEIEVEIRCYIGNGNKESDSFKDPLVTNTGIPKLDENDCLILKKK
jgi:hypothetical protein